MGSSQSPKITRPPTPPPEGRQALNQTNHPNPYESPSALNPPHDPYPQYHGPFPEPRPSNVFATASIILGIIALIACFLGIIIGIIAVIFGHLSLTKMENDPRLAGKGMTIAGLIAGYFAIIIKEN